MRVNHIGQFAEPHPALHRHRDLADHVAGMTTDNRRPRELIRAFLHEYFHGDDGAVLGASHQNGWTGLVAKLIQQSGGTTEAVDEADKSPQGSNPAPAV
jgi:hypothetical protein